MPIIRTLALASSVLAIAACSVAPITAPATQTSDHGFQTQQWIGPQSPYNNNYYNPYLYGGAGISPFAGAGLYGGGLGYGGGIGYGASFNNYALPLASDIYGGLTVVTDRGRIDRQPATLPPGVAEENDEAYRPIGSAIWKRK